MEDGAPDPPAPEPSRFRAFLESVAAVAVIGACLAISRVPRIADALADLPYALGFVLTVLTTALVVVSAIALLVRRDADPWRSLGLSRAPIGDVIGWSAGATLLTFAAGAAVGVIWLVAARFGAGPPPVPLLELRGEIADRARWMLVFADLPLAAVFPLALVIAVYEELLFRGFLLGRLRVVLRASTSRARLVLAVILAAALFSLGHGYQGLLGVAQTFAAGTALGAVAARRASIYPTILAHAIVDSTALTALHFLKPYLEQLGYGQ